MWKGSGVASSFAWSDRGKPRTQQVGFPVSSRLYHIYAIRSLTFFRRSEHRFIHTRCSLSNGLNVVTENEVKNDNQIKRLHILYSDNVRGRMTKFDFRQKLKCFRNETRSATGATQPPRELFLGGIAGSWSLTSLRCKRQECVKFFFQSPYISWCGN